MHLFQTAQRWSLHTLLPAMLCLTCSSFISLEANEPPVVHAGPPPVMEHAWVAGPLVRSVSAQLAELLADYISDPDGDPLSIKIVAMQGLWERSNDAAFDAPQPVQSGDIVPLTAWVRFRPVPYSFPPGNPGLLESALEFRAWDGQALSATVGTITVSYQNTAPQLAAALINGNEATPQWTLHAEVIDATATIYLLAEDQEGDSVTWGYFSNAGVLVPITGAQENVSDAAVHGRVSLYPDPDLGILQIDYTATTPGGLDDLLRLAILGPFGEQQEITIHYTHAPVEPTSLPQVSVMVIDPIAVEGSGEGNPARIRIMRTAVSGSPLTVYFQKSGIAVPAYDYVDIGTAATIPANQVAVDIVVQSLFVDGFSEGAESVRITLIEHQTYEIIEPRSAEVYIFDVGYEPPTVSLSATPLHIREDDPMGELSITVERTGNLVGPLFVSLAVHGTALEGVDYNGFFGIGDPVVIIPHGLSAVTLHSFVINDELAEDLETIDIEIVPLVTYVRAPASRIVIEITDDDGGSAVPIVSVTAEDAEASEGTPPDPARLIIARTGDLTQPLFVHVTWNGSAQNALDVVTLEETVTIPAGFPSIEVLVIPIDDHIDEPEEVLVISIVAQPTYQVGDPASALITIGDNDKPSVSLVAMDSQAAEGPTPDTGMITIYREGVLSEELTVVLAISGTATGGTDYEALGTSVTIPEGEAQVTLTVTPLEDTEFEGAETVVVTLQSGAAYVVGSPASATVTIADNDVNHPPALVSPDRDVSWMAIVGESWTQAVKAEDLDSSDALELEVTEQPSWLSVERVAGRSWRLRGIPPVAGTVVWRLCVVDQRGARSAERHVTLQVVPAATVVLTVALPEASTRSNPRYGPLAPGSSRGFETLRDAFRDLFPTRARAVWWQGGYRDLPELPPVDEREYRGVFFATTVTRPFTLPAVPRRAAPYAVPLPAGSSAATRWHFIGVPPLAVDGSGTTETTHAWGDFRLETSDGQPVTDEAVVLDVLASGIDSDPRVRIQPYLWDGTRYVRAGVLQSGVAYWVPNFGSQSYRLVRTAAGDRRGRFADLTFSGSAPGRATRVRAHSVVDRSGPPAPPAFEDAVQQAEPSAVSAAPPAQTSAGGCGAGALAMVCAAFVAVRLRRSARR
ncbi:MAG: Calx-beta domain-containing protein [Planctomycetota bacterium]|nr:Calx-beta domain-containing protein [Planctomycetota bacterium]